ncbi:nucleotidyltransferase family protein [Microbulbifer hydrolyticus]|uniref:Molybdenum cofactor cytidylyltransferase n=1 Tax=Microbulbifer hydrolyticus TaxID=48074 RepID=A0A6P1T9V9_9GAMM|nr:nucleotidyltransferase family protein [Microbulbifer hydrolyticus]MBB5213198.1 molybdenum cofactor cytidylyltransferase [Microbulbifer hydrolyticus]QHQ38535.1 NTP transferase domain-containing protein [Microbulbifer hydrolyticus]
MEYSLVVLAAGYSHRFGSDKRLASIQGEPMLLRTLQTVLEASAEVRDSAVQVILRARDPVMANGLKKMPVQVLHAPVWPVSMGASLAFAVESLQRAGANPKTVLVCMGDMPFVEPETLVAILRAAREDRIHVPVCAGTRGYPIAIGRKYLSALSRLRNTSMEKVLRIFDDAVVDVEVNDPAINCDINRPDDFHAAVRQDLFGKIFASPDKVEGELLPSPTE